MPLFHNIVCHVPCTSFVIDATQLLSMALLDTAAGTVVVNVSGSE